MPSPPSFSFNPVGSRWSPVMLPSRSPAYHDSLVCQPSQDTVSPVELQTPCTTYNLSQSCPARQKEKHERHKPEAASRWRPNKTTLSPLVRRSISPLQLRVALPRWSSQASLAHMKKKSLSGQAQTPNHAQCMRYHGHAWYLTLRGPGPSSQHLTAPCRFPTLPRPSPPARRRHIRPFDISTCRGAQIACYYSLVGEP